MTTAIAEVLPCTCCGLSEGVDRRPVTPRRFSERDATGDVTVTVCPRCDRS